MHIAYSSRLPWCLCSLLHLAWSEGLHGSRWPSWDCPLSKGHVDSLRDEGEGEVGRGEIGGERREEGGGGRMVPKGERRENQYIP